MCLSFHAQMSLKGCARLHLATSRLWRCATPKPKWKHKRWKTQTSTNQREQELTYRRFVRGVLIFTAHVAVVLLVLAWVFSDNFGSVAVTG
jgi:hypothetical protein